MSEVIPVSRCTAYPVLAIIGAAVVLSACSLLPFPGKQQPATEQTSAMSTAEDTLDAVTAVDAGTTEVLPLTDDAVSKDIPPQPAADQQELHIVPVMADRDQSVMQGEASDEGAQLVTEAIPPNTFLVASAPKDKSHLYYGIGSPLGLVVNGVQGKELVVVRGESYTFKVDTGVQHDFYLSLSDKGWGAATLTDGVKGNYTYKGVVVFEPNNNTPDVVFYQCRNHKSMGSKIHIVDKGMESSVVFGVRDEVSPGKSKTTFTTAIQAEQKVKFADMFIAMSPAAKRIDASDHVEAKQLLAQARARLDDAKTALAKGENEQTIGITDDALRKMSAASQLVPSETQMAELQAKYQELLRGTQDFEKSYRRNYSLMKKKGKKDLPELDIELMSKMIVDAQKLADNNQFDEATKQLQKVQRDITRALSSLLSDETMDYTLTFANAKEEYEYELSRYKSYDELVPIAIEQKQPPKQTLALMDQFVEKARSIYVLAGPKAAEGDYNTAIQMLQGATSHLQRALRIVGVR